MKFQGQYLKELRLENGLTQHQLSRLTCIPAQEISRLENNRKSYNDDYTQEMLRRYFFPNSPSIKKFIPFLTEDQIINAKPLLDYKTGLTVGDVINDNVERLILMKSIYK